MKTLAIIIPAYNEGQGIGLVLRELRVKFPEDEIVVVDDASTDNTFSEAKKHDVTVISHPFNQGYGASLKTGMSLVDCDYIAWFDADGEHQASDLHIMWTQIRSKKVGAVLGNRLDTNRSNIWEVGKKVIKLTANILGVRLTHDINCGLRIFHRSAIIPWLNLLPNGFSASLTSTLILIERKIPLVYQNIIVKERVGVSKTTIWDGWHTITKIMRLVLLFGPLRIFLPLGVFFVLSGIAYGVHTSLSTGRGIPTLGLLLILLGILSMISGILSDQISQLRLERPQIFKKTK